MVSIRNVDLNKFLVENITLLYLFFTHTPSLLMEKIIINININISIGSITLLY